MEENQDPWASSANINVSETAADDLGFNLQQDEYLMAGNTIIRPAAHEPSTRPECQQCEGAHVTDSIVIDKPVNPFQEIVHVIVGWEKEIFSAHKYLLCFRSPYFLRAFNGPFTEGQSGVLELNHVRPKIFELFVDWVYSGQIGYSSFYSQRSCVIDNPRDQHTERLELITLKDLFELWILADYFQTDEIENPIVFEIRNIREHEDFALIEACELLYSKAPENSTMQKELVMFCVDRCDSDQLERLRLFLPQYVD